MDSKRLGLYQKNPVNLTNSVKYNYSYNYYPPYIKGINNSPQYPYTSFYKLLNNDPYLRKVPDNLAFCNINILAPRSKMIYLNSTDKNWGAQTVNRKYWEQQNQTYESNDRLLQDKIDKIKYEETKRNNKNLKKAYPNNLKNGYYNWGNKNNNWYYQNKCQKGKNRMYCNFGINTDVYTGSTYKIILENINKDPIYYKTHTYKQGGIINKDQWYDYKPNYIKTGRSIYDLGISKKY